MREERREKREERREKREERRYLQSNLSYSIIYI
jgi:hypothetical protein